LFWFYIWNLTWYLQGLYQSNRPHMLHFCQLVKFDTWPKNVMKVNFPCKNLNCTGQLSCFFCTTKIWFSSWVSTVLFDYFEQSIYEKNLINTRKGILLNTVQAVHLQYVLDSIKIQHELTRRLFFPSNVWSCHEKKNSDNMLSW
jgi:hypothetical protein